MARSAYRTYVPARMSVSYYGIDRARSVNAENCLCPTVRIRTGTGRDVSPANKTA